MQSSFGLACLILLVQLNDAVNQCLGETNRQVVALKEVAGDLVGFVALVDWDGSLAAGTRVNWQGKHGIGLLLRHALGLGGLGLRLASPGPGPGPGLRISLPRRLPRARASGRPGAASAHGRWHRRSRAPGRRVAECDCEVVDIVAHLDGKVLLLAVDVNGHIKELGADLCAAALEVIAISATAKMYARIAHSVWTGQVMCGSLGSYCTPSDTGTLPGR